MSVNLSKKVSEIAKPLFPSPRPSLAGRGRINSRLPAKWPQSAASRLANFENAFNGCSRSPGERVRVRENAANHFIRRILSLSRLLVFLAAASGVRATNPTVIIPAPAKAEVRDGQFQLTAASRLVADRELTPEAQLLAARLKPATGFALKIKSATTKISDGDILLTTNGADAALGPEGYELT